MRSVLVAAIAASLLAGASPALGADTTSPPDEQSQRLYLPGYEVAVQVPAHWEVEPTLGGPTGISLSQSSPYVGQMWTAAGGREEGQWCQLNAYARLGCAVPADLETEFAGTDLYWRDYPAGPVAHLEGSPGIDAACVRHLTTDGLDVFEVVCCGEETPADEWRSIVETLELPAETRRVRVAAQGRNLLEDASVTWDLWSSTYGPILGYLEGGGSASTAAERIWDPPVEAMVEALDLPPESIRIHELVSSDEQGDEVLGIDGIRARRVQGLRASRIRPESMRDGMLAWAEAEWAAGPDGMPSVEAVSVSGMDVLKATFEGVEATEYLVAEGDSALKVRGATDEFALSWLEGLSCDHVDTHHHIIEALKAAMPDG